MGSSDYLDGEMLVLFAILCKVYCMGGLLGVVCICLIKMPMENGESLEVDSGKVTCLLRWRKSW